MSVTDTAKEVVRIASTAGLAKDVVDLMEKKLAILTSDLDKATSEVASLQHRIAKLEEQNRDLQSQLQSTQPKDDLLPRESEQMLVVFAGSSRGTPSDQVIRELGLPQAKGDYYFDQLLKREFVHASSGQGFITPRRLGGTT